MSKKKDADISSQASLVWKIANDVLRDIFQRTEYPDIIYPMVLLRRLECVLVEETNKVNSKFAKSLKEMNKAAAKKFITDKLLGAVGYSNDSKFTLQELKNEGESSIKNNFIQYLNGFHSKKQNNHDETDKIKEVINNSGIRKHIDKLQTNKILYSLIEEFANVDLSPKKVSNIQMGYIFEELIRRFSEQNNSEAGEHYTPREVIDLMIHLLDIDDRKLNSGELVTIYVPACGTGGMLSAAKEFIAENVNKDANIRLFGQEVNDKTWAICEADLMMKGEDAKVVHGDTLTEDGFKKNKFDFMLSNPPYGKSWAKIQKKVMAESNGRFDVGQPRSSDGQLLFTLHMISKMKTPEEGGTAIAIVHNGSPLFSGDAGSGESEIRKYILEHDLLESIVALPTELFYNTGIATYIWLIRNNKPKKRKGKIQLINAIDFWKPMKRSLGNKRKRIHDGYEGNGDNAKYVKENDQLLQIIKMHKDFEKADSKYSKIFDIEDFAFRKVSLDLEEIDEDGNPAFEEKEISIAQNKIEGIVITKPKDEQLIKLKDKEDKEGEFTFTINPKSELLEKYYTPDKTITIKKIKNGTKLTFKASINIPKIVKDTEYIPWKEDKQAFLKKEVEKKWIITKEEKGYEIPFTKHFYVYQPLREQTKVVNEMAEMEKENLNLMSQLGIKL